MTSSRHPLHPERRWRRWLGIQRLAALATLLAAPPVLGQVTLDTAVRKVETTLEAGGRARRELVPVEEVVPGEELRYTITFSNESATPVEPERIVITNPIPDGTDYLSGSAGGEDTVVEYSLDGRTWSRVEPGPERPAAADAESATEPGAVSAAIGFPGDPVSDPVSTRDASPVRSLRWTYTEELAPGESEQVFFHVRMQ